MKSAIERRESYLRRRGDRMKRIIELYEEDFERAEDEYQKLKAPVDRTFVTLKQKLRSLLTREQLERQKAAGDGDLN